MQDTVCSLQHISKEYRTGNSVQKVFSDLTMTLSLKGITVFLGKSGCGKTTLLRILANLEQPENGKIVYWNAGKRNQPKIGMVFQESRLFPWLDLAQNIMLSREHWNEEDVLPYLHMVGLEPQYLHSKPESLSGGMAQRVAIARALAYQPDVLLMDEPFAALDYFTRMALQQKMIEIQQQTNVTIFFVTHHVEEALLLANQIVILKKGSSPYSFSIGEPHPRQLNLPQFIQYKQKILSMLLQEKVDGC